MIGVQLESLSGKKTAEAMSGSAWLWVKLNGNDSLLNISITRSFQPIFFHVIMAFRFKLINLNDLVTLTEVTQAFSALVGRSVCKLFIFRDLPTDEKLSAMFQPLQWFRLLN